jgi:hypothetical protein
MMKLATLLTTVLLTVSSAYAIPESTMCPPSHTHTYICPSSFDIHLPKFTVNSQNNVKWYDATKTFNPILQSGNYVKNSTNKKAKLYCNYNDGLSILGQSFNTDECDFYCGQTLSNKLCTRPDIKVCCTAEQ